MDSLRHFHSYIGTNLEKEICIKILNYIAARISSMIGTNLTQVMCERYDIPQFCGTSEKNRMSVIVHLKISNLLKKKKIMIMKEKKKEKK